MMNEDCKWIVGFTHPDGRSRYHFVNGPYRSSIYERIECIQWNVVHLTAGEEIAEGTALTTEAAKLIAETVIDWHMKTTAG